MDEDVGSVAGADGDDSRIVRIRLLSDELDKQRSRASDRTRSVETRCSFLVVASGVLVAFGVAGDGVPTNLADVAVLILATATVVCAVVGLWPRKLRTASGDKIVGAWVDAPLSGPELEDHLLEVKRKEIENRNALNEWRAGWAIAGFTLIGASVFAMLISTMARVVL